MTKEKSAIKLPLKNASETQIAAFLEANDPEELEREGIMVRDEDRSNLEGLLRSYLSEPNDAQLNIRLPRSARALLSRIANQKTVDASTLARIWIVERLRREMRT